MRTKPEPPARTFRDGRANLNDVDVEGLRNSPIGRLEPISGTDPRTGDDWRYWAYVPKPLPSSPDLLPATHQIATAAAMQLARLDQAMTQLPRPELLVRPILRREAVATSALEGTYATFDEVLEAEFLAENQQSQEQREVINYIRATELALERSEKYPICRTLLGPVQKEIVRNTPDDSGEAGDLRQHQVAIGPKNRPISEARLVPSPPGPILVDGFSDWEKWVNDNTLPLSPVIKIAMGHYQFETLHPYNNGNGRLGRLIMVLQLIADNIMTKPVLNLARWLEERKDDYIAGLLKVSHTGDFNPWVSFISEGVKIQAENGVKTINDLLALKSSYSARLREAGARGAAMEVADILIGFPIIDVSTAAKLIDRPFETANQAISKLVTLGVLREITGRRTHRLFLCADVLRIANGAAH
ncbi:hypothetical protein GCM10010123_30480 [Pilimelia anulata]|uniref:Fido domain-containing protein n=1 Tax=Pilimelia anulata TaxID=53371 RepID=A0A8J3FE13_9ACTN|nr:hypothetical protein GCM10010123_30480 [Pilimelia anulata]